MRDRYGMERHLIKAGGWLERLWARKVAREYELMLLNSCGVRGLGMPEDSLLAQIKTKLETI